MRPRTEREWLEGVEEDDGLTPIGTAGAGRDESGGVRIRLGGSNAGHEHHARNGFGLALGEVIGNPACPIMRRWVLETPAGSLRLHHFLRSDDARALHDHPWWFVTVPLSRGGYLDQTYCPGCGGSGLAPPYPESDPWDTFCQRAGCVAGRVSERVRWLRPTFRPAGHTHAVVLDRGPCWTLIVSGRKARRWGFWDRLGGTFHESRAFFGRFGHAPCED